MRIHSKIKVVLILLITILVARFIYWEMTTPHLTNEFVGTYSYGEGSNICLMAVAPQDGNTFYYADQTNHIFLKGTYEERSNEVYFLTSDYGKAKQILKDQEICYHNQVFTMIAGNHKMTFKKIDNIPTIINDSSQYR